MSRTRTRIFSDYRIRPGTILIVIGAGILIGTFCYFAIRATQPDGQQDDSLSAIASPTAEPTPTATSAALVPTITTNMTLDSMYPTAAATATAIEPTTLPSTSTATSTSTPVDTATPEPTSTATATQSTTSPTQPPTPTTASPQTQPSPAPPAATPPPLPTTEGESPTTAPAPQAPQAVAQAEGGDPVHISIPAVGIDTDVVEVGYNLVEMGGQTVIQWNVASWAAGHQLLSADPGQGGNVVIAGHVIGNGAVFRDLYQAEVGDEVIVRTATSEYRYTIVELHLRQDEGAPLEERLAAGVFMAPMPEERLTLITCWPDGVYDDRLIVVAKP